MAPARVAQAARVPMERWRDRERYRPSYNMQPGGWGVVVRHNRDDHQPELQSMQ
jgi:putative SOS response-associated peptidase YedK